MRLLQTSLRAGPRGPTSISDPVARERISHFDHERIPERVVHARGAGAHGKVTLVLPKKYVGHKLTFTSAVHSTQESGACNMCQGFD